MQVHVYIYTTFDRTVVLHTTQQVKTIQVCRRRYTTVFVVKRGPTHGLTLKVFKLRECTGYRLSGTSQIRILYVKYLQKSSPLWIPWSPSPRINHPTNQRQRLPSGLRKMTPYSYQTNGIWAWARSTVIDWSKIQLSKYMHAYLIQCRCVQRCLVCSILKRVYMKGATAMLTISETRSDVFSTRARWSTLAKKKASKSTPYDGLKVHGGGPVSSCCLWGCGAAAPPVNFSFDSLWPNCGCRQIGRLLGMT